MKSNPSIAYAESNFYKYYVEKGGLSDEQFKQLEPYFEFKEVPHNSYILRQGEICHHTFFVESGLLQAFTLDEKGGEHIIQFAPENWIIADRSSLYFNEPSDYFIKAIEPTIVVYLKKEFAEEATKISTSFACFNDTSLQRNIYFQQKRIHSLLAMTAKERYLSFMEMYPNLILRVPQWMIASYLGITPESLSRVRKEIVSERQKK
ncbi:Crp/Fnr family transcriptional regulator [Sphingobacterium hungaricum]|uniref:Cyclic nucleotide-binding domain-containing protein n=1 Tax=Sphingobacterium hungaricum TaxID=2082723 RepID=A0A928YPW8_9SPHI|nr:Crp/Fnr family transcriptional regulator [Sphingobacterium hungaricum]MBE8712992.1 hypothetical protein [Sphingobacterium hungaricum]